MDILKKALNNLETCTVQDNTVTVCGRTYPNAPVTFTIRKNATYSLQAVIFYLINKDQGVKEYIKRCQLHKVQSITYVDQKSIIEDILNYQAAGFDGHFILPTYTNDKHYTIFDRGHHIIIVPGDILAPVNSTNFYFLLGPKDTSESSSGSVIEKNACKYTITDSVENLKDSDWKSVKAIFLDHCNKNLAVNNEHVAKLIRTRKAFSLSKDIPGETIVFKNGEIQNKDEIWEKIESL